MPKIKTLQSAKKRFKITALGNYKHKHAYMRHILTKKSTKHKRHLRQKSILPTIYVTTIMKCLPYI
ncbi:50S ribosomal protein L35 [Blochmannia endosymbiont of Camponotus sp. C-003]|uniref:50S ribosomal protein L35 n=1 Tax=unclassified Candidatus Blochmanniella TaxID=711328 RepID=UPI002024B607|nr:MULTISPECIES: 50S ribosomal protein L35 [unclassified Candidatus Blochmannia]URJ23462.1 50S ribosomal protein L35 [Blochmannia endosymbiont of Camponotus sp. C-003]URJ28934.1 50S ribosomal protein L35 [Blochmannia endosymbiont of Camponotus sp. C-046]